jgi:flagellum-specific peptidoglycan hydrolase FlgJ
MKNLSLTDVLKLEQIAVLGTLQLKKPHQLKVIMAQALIETGFFNENIPNSYYNRSNHTNWFGMGYNKRGYAIGSFNGANTTKSEAWAVYPSSWAGIKDRLSWDKQFKTFSPLDSVDTSDYADRLAYHHYWVENGRDKGYKKLLMQIIKDHNATFDIIIGTPPVLLIGSAIYLL